MRPLDDGRVELDLADRGTVTVTVGREAVASPTPLTCKGADGLSYPAFRLLALDH